jgi:hypothetical protein
VFPECSAEGGGGSSSEQVPETCESAWSIFVARGGEVGCSMQSTPPFECAPSSPLRACAQVRPTGSDAHSYGAGQTVFQFGAGGRARGSSGPAGSGAGASSALPCPPCTGRLECGCALGALLRHAQGPVFPGSNACAMTPRRGTLSPSTRGCLNLPPENTKPRCHQAFHPCFLLLVSQT